MKLSVIILSALFFFVSCSKNEEREDQIPSHFFIQQGEHFSQWFPGKYNGRLLPKDFLFIFRWNELPEDINSQYLASKGLNMLFGYSFDRDPHKNSARIAWRINSKMNCIEYYGYLYENSQLKKVRIGSEDLENNSNPLCASIYDDEMTMYFTVGDSLGSIPLEHEWPDGKVFLSYPYYGSDDPAPDDISVSISLIDSVLCTVYKERGLELFDFQK